MNAVKLNDIVMNWSIFTKMFDQNCMMKIQESTCL